MTNFSTTCVKKILVDPMKSILTLLGFLMVCFTIAGAGGYITSTSVSTWYPTLAKPDWTPSGSTIGLVWNVLFLLMAIAGWRVYQQTPIHSHAKTMALRLYVVQLVLNLLWSVCFFGLRMPGLAAIELLLLETAIIFTLIYFWRMDRLAGVLLIPYALWVAFAGVLNVSIWWLNRPTAGLS